MTASTAQRRVWLVLVLLVGLLGMHGLASDHSGMAASTAMSPATAAVHPAAHAGMHMAALAAAEHAVDAGAVLPGGHGAMAMAGLCLAVLAGVVVMVAVARGGSPFSGRQDGPGASRVSARDPGPDVVRPPDLVAGLCVSRT